MTKAPTLREDSLRVGRTFASTTLFEVASTMQHASPLERANAHKDGRAQIVALPFAISLATTTATARTQTLAPASVAGRG